jgi:hypothetical protein
MNVCEVNVLLRVAERRDECRVGYYSTGCARRIRYQLIDLFVQNDFNNLQQGFDKILRLPPSADSWLHLQQLGVRGELRRSPLC